MTVLFTFSDDDKEGLRTFWSNLPKTTTSSQWPFRLHLVSTKPSSVTFGEVIDPIVYFQREQKPSTMNFGKVDDPFTYH